MRGNSKKLIAVVLSMLLSVSIMFACAPPDPPSDDATYVVTFDIGADATAAGVTAPTPREVGKGLTTSEPTVVWTGKVVEWQLDGAKYDFSTPINSNITLTAKWYNSVTVTFSLGAEALEAGLTPPSAQTFKEGERATEPAAPAFTGYKFNGWLLNGEAFSFTTAVNTNITLVADFSIDESAQKYEENIASWSKPGHFYLHYKRYSHAASEEGYAAATSTAPNYSVPASSSVSPTYYDFALWAWEYAPTNGTGRTFNIMKIDESGAVFDILLDNTYTDAGWNNTTLRPDSIEINFSASTALGIQLFQLSSRSSAGSFWANDGGNVYIQLDEAKRADGSYHWFVNQGYVSKGSATFSANEEIKDPYEGVEEGSAVSSGNINSLGAQMAYTETVKDYSDMGVGYQIFLASFADSNGDGMGDLRGIIENLDYLESLNVDVLWLTPFQSSTNYHGYDINDYYSVDQRFGTISDYRELVYKAHKRGMKVLMDFVLNHTSRGNPWFVNSQNLVKQTVTSDSGKEEIIDYRNFYSWKNKEQYDALTAVQKKHWYGPDEHGYYFYSSFSSEMPELNFDYQPVRDAIIDVAKYWMSFGIDGFRLDAVKHIYMCNEIGDDSTSGAEGIVSEVSSNGDFSFNTKRNSHFFREFNARLKAVYPEAILLGENLDGWTARSAWALQGMDTQFDFDMYYNITGAIHEKHTSSLAAGLNTAVNDLRAIRPDYIGGLFTSNHDLQRARDRLLCKGSYGNYQTDMHTVNSPSSLFDYTERVSKLYINVIMTLPGLNWIYYGDELGTFGTMTNDASHADRIYRQPLKWKTDYSGYTTSYSIGSDLYVKIEENSLNDLKLDSVEVQDADADSLLNAYRKATEFRDAHPEIISGRIYNISATGSRLSYTITKNDKTFYIHHNFSEYASNVGGSGTVVYNTHYNVSGATAKTLGGYGTLVVEA